MREKEFDVQTLIDSLTGTCTTIQENLPEGMDWEDLTKDDHQAIDTEIFCCEQCGWWCEICEMSEDAEQTCCDCSN